MISKSFGHLLTGTCIVNVKNNIFVHINRNQFWLNMQYINPMLWEGNCSQKPSLWNPHLSLLIIIANYAYYWVNFCTILGDALVRNKAFMGTNRNGFPIFIWLYLFLSLFLLLFGIVLSHLSLLNEIDMFKYSILILWTFFFSSVFELW